MEREHLISIIIPVFNVEKYLEQCLLSVIGQSYTNIEIVLVDDGSTDDSYKICTRYEDIDCRIKCIHQENRGLSAARNVGVRASRGELITFVDPDDTVEREYVEELYCAMQNTGADISIGYLDNGDTTAKAMKYSLKVVHKEKALIMLTLDKIPISATSKLYHRGIVEKINFVEGMNFEDSLFTHQILNECETISIVTSIIYHYRIREGSITQTFSKANIEDRINSYKMVEDFLKDRYSSESIIYISRVINYWYSCEYCLTKYRDNYSVSDTKEVVIEELNAYKDSIRKAIVKSKLSYVQLLIHGNFSIFIKRFIIHFCPDMYYPLSLIKKTISNII